MNEVEYLMHINTGSVDTRENWLADFEACDYGEWFGYESKQEMKNKGVYEYLEWDHDLVEVVKDENGDWVEAK